MIEKTAEGKLGSWSSPESNRTIEYPLELLDEIRLTVSSSFHMRARGGLEIGGVLFGSRSENAIRIAAWRPIACDHSQGGSFILSENDQQELARLLESSSVNPDLKGLDVAGWFVSHTRSGLALTESDAQVFERFFPEQWQCTLVLQPQQVEPMRAAFFVRDAGGKVCGHTAEREFTVEPLRGARQRRQAPVSNVVGEIAQNPSQTRASSYPPVEPLVRLRPERPVRPAPMSQEAPPIKDRRTRSKISWWQLGWALPLIAIALLAGFLAKDRYRPEAHAETLSLKVQDAPGAQLHVDWDKQSRPIQVAQRGVLDINDGGNHRTVDLDAMQLRQGSLTYGRRSGDVKVGLSVYGENNSAPLTEVAEFLGPPAANPPAPDVNAARAKEKADLEAEVKRLRAQLGREQAKSQELQNLVRVLENRLSIKVK